MKYVKVVLILTVVGFFAGCQCPQKKRAEKIKKHEEAKKVPEIQEIIKEIEKPVEKPKVTEKKEETPIVKKGEVPPEKLPPEKEVKKAEEELAKIFKNIYFDFDKYYIRPDAAKELDKIVKVMNKYPTMEIELSSHTDCSGSSIYNLKLSDKRAKASADYIKKRITNPTRINGQGYGETHPVNDCACEGGRGLKCTEEQHQQNRRTEFKIIRK